MNATSRAQENDRRAQNKEQIDAHSLIHSLSPAEDGTCPSAAASGAQIFHPSAIRAGVSSFLFFHLHVHLHLLSFCFFRGLFHFLSFCVEHISVLQSHVLSFCF